MKRLGYTQFVAQGGDWGDAVTEQMGAAGAAGTARHSHQHAGDRSRRHRQGAHSSASPPPAGLSADEKHAYDQLDFFYKHGLGYAQEMANRPQTLYGIADSPVGLAAWILDHDARSYALIARVFDGQPEGLTRDDILDNITLYWLTNTGVSSARLYWENKLAFFAPKNVTIPVAVSAFPTRSTRRRGAGRSGRIRSSSTTTSSPKAGTLRRGSSPCSYRRGSRGFQALAQIAEA